MPLDDVITVQYNQINLFYSQSNVKCGGKKFPSGWREGGGKKEKQQKKIETKNNERNKLQNTENGC